MRQLFISLSAIIISLFSGPLFADAPIEYPKLYQNLWPEFCKNHLLNESQACSEININSSVDYSTDNTVDYSSEDGEDDEYYEGLSFISAPVCASVNHNHLAEYYKELSLIPYLETPCAYLFCNECRTPVLNSIGILNSDITGNNFAIDHRCHCSNRIFFITSKNYQYCPDNEWIGCNNLSIPFAYFNQFTATYSPFLKQHLQYCKQNAQCQCYWPYTSPTACQISNLVFNEMHFMFQKSSLAELIHKHSDWLMLDEFPLKDWPLLGNETLLRTLQNHFIFSFFYSNYHTSIINLCTYVDAHSLTPLPELQRLYSLLATIRPLFLNLYSSCLSEHPHPKLYYERGMVYFHEGNFYASLSDMKDFVNSADDEETLLSSDFYLQEGSSYAELGLYDAAIEALAKSIAKDPNNKAAYFERAAIYFERGDFDLSIADYLTSGMKPTLLDHNDLLSIEFSKYLTSGILQGTGKAAVDYIPSILSSINGLSHALWAFSCDPLHCSQEIVSTCRDLIELLSQKSSIELLETFIPEVREFNNSSSNEEQARLLGYMIGKYGTELFAPFAVIKTYKKFKTANKLLTLERLAQESKQAAIIQEAAGNWRVAHAELIEKFKNTEGFLKTLKGKKFTETEVRKIIHQAGFATFPRPKGIPNNFIATFSDRGCGMKYIHPNNPHISIRVMPGKPYSPMPYQRNPYVIQKRDGKAFDRYGRLVPHEAPEAHIPFDEFIYRN